MFTSFSALRRRARLERGLSFFVCGVLSLGLLSGCHFVQQGPVTPLSTESEVSAGTPPEQPPTPETKVEEPQALVAGSPVFPEPLKDEQGQEITVEPEAGVPILVTLDGQQIQLGLFRSLAEGEVNSLIRLISQGSFDGTGVGVSAEGHLILRAQASVPKLAVADQAGSKIAPSLGALFFDGESQLLITSGRESRSEGWVCVGYSLTSSGLWEAARTKQGPIEPTAEEGLSPVLKVSVVSI